MTVIEEKALERSNEVTCTLSLSGTNFDPEKCAQQLGISGTRIWRRRKAPNTTGITLPDAALQFSDGPVECDSLDVVASTLLARLFEHEQAILSVAEEHNLSISLACLVRVYTDPPSYAFSRSIVRKLGALNAALSVDIIDLRE
jgi:hypothetical protein